MPTLCSSRQPTIAVVTALYCEKQAVDAMMDNQETYVRYTTVGKYFIRTFELKLHVYRTSNVSYQQVACSVPNTVTFLMWVDTK